MRHPVGHHARVCTHGHVRSAVGALLASGELLGIVHDMLLLLRRLLEVVLGRLRCRRAGRIGIVAGLTLAEAAASIVWWSVHSWLGGAWLWLVGLRWLSLCE